jgi:hypothetical protein
MDVGVYCLSLCFQVFPAATQQLSAELGAHTGLNRLQVIVQFRVQVVI